MCEQNQLTQNIAINLNNDIVLLATVLSIAQHGVKLAVGFQGNYLGAMVESVVVGFGNLTFMR